MAVVTAACWLELSGVPGPAAEFEHDAQQSTRAAHTASEIKVAAGRGLKRSRGIEAIVTQLPPLPAHRLALGSIAFDE